MDDQAMDRSRWSIIGSESGLRDIVGAPLQRVVNKVRDRLHDFDMQFIAASPFWLVGTAAADGSCDVSPKGDPAGSVHVLDDRTLVLPDRPGNKRVDGFLDVLENPHVGLLFLLPGRGDTLRVKGRATLVGDAPFFDDLIVNGHRPSLALVVDVEAVYYHCAKAFMRSALWDPSTWNPDAVPSRPVIAQAMERPDDTIDELEAYYGNAYRETLY